MIERLRPFSVVGGITWRRMNRDWSLPKRNACLKAFLDAAVKSIGTRMFVGFPICLFLATQNY
jgi:hypothetical protein